MMIMTSREPATGTQRRARILLAAWNSGDLSRLREAVAQPQEDASTAAEQERAELLDAATETIRTWLKQPQRCLDADLQVSLGLLHHVSDSNPATAGRPSLD
jgi:hypothetical protein